jgi:AcrR family transcriptional regulator
MFDEKQLEIIEKASEVFMRFGIRSVTMDDLAKELGVSKKTFYKYFEDKDALIRSIIISKTEIDKQLCVIASKQAENAIDAMIRINEFSSSMLQNVHSSVFYDLQKYHREAWGIMENHKNVFVAGEIEANIRRGIEEGVYRDNIDANIISKAYVKTIDALFDGETFPAPDYNFNHVFTEIVRFQIRGLASEKGLEYLKKRLNQ